MNAMKSVKQALSKAPGSTQSLTYRKLGLMNSDDEQEGKAFREKYLWCSFCEYTFQLGEAIVSLDKSAQPHTIDSVVLECPRLLETGEPCQGNSEYFSFWHPENAPQKWHQSDDYPPIPDRDIKYKGI